MSKSKNHREFYKFKSNIIDQNKRRDEYILKQKEIRKDRTDYARRLATSAFFATYNTQNENEQDDTMEEEQIENNNDRMIKESNEMEIINVEKIEKINHKKKKSQRKNTFLKYRKKYAHQLMIPEWMITIPFELRLNTFNQNNNIDEEEKGFYVLPRPEGTRCLVISSNGNTIARLISGSIIKKFQSNLPNGSKENNRSKDGYCILDCIFNEEKKTFYILDMMCWKGYSLYDCSVVFRFFWISTKIPENDIITSQHAYNFGLIPYFECDESGLFHAHSEEFSFQKDGLLFYLKAGHYTLGTTPLVLLWKDSYCSPYFNNTIQCTLSAVLLVDENGNLRTAEDIIVYNFSEEFLLENEITEFDYVRVTFEDVIINESTNEIKLVNITFQKKCSIQRGLADSCSKIIFYNKAKKNNSISMNDLQHYISL